MSEGEPRQRKGRKPKPKIVVVSKKESKDLKTNSTEVIEKEGKYVVVAEKHGLQIQTPIPKGMSPVEYLQTKQFGIIQRVENIAVTGTPEDNIKLKANLALLNKVIPDITRTEIEVRKSPYERILEMLDGVEETKDEPDSTV